MFAQFAAPEFDNDTATTAQPRRFAKHEVLKRFFRRQVTDFMLHPARGVLRVGALALAGTAITTSSPALAFFGGMFGLGAACYGGMMSFANDLMAFEDGSRRADIIQRYRNGATPDELFEDTKKPTVSERIQHFLRHPVKHIRSALRNAPSNNLGLIIAGTASVLAGVDAFPILEAGYETIDLKPYVYSTLAACATLFGGAKIAAHINRTQTQRKSMATIREEIEQDYAERQAGTRGAETPRAESLGPASLHML